MQVCPFFASNHPIRLLNLIQFDPCRGTLRSHQAWCLKTGKYPIKMEVLLGKWSIFIGDVRSQAMFDYPGVQRDLRLKSLLPMHLENATVTADNVLSIPRNWLVICPERSWKIAIIIPGTTCHCQWSSVLSSTVQLEYSDVLHIRVWERVLKFFKLQWSILGTSNSQVAKILGK